MQAFYGGFQITPPSSKRLGHFLHHTSSVVCLYIYYYIYFILYLVVDIHFPSNLQSSGWQVACLGQPILINPRILAQYLARHRYPTNLNLLLDFF